MAPKIGFARERLRTSFENASSSFRVVGESGKVLLSLVAGEIVGGVERSFAARVQADVPVIITEDSLVDVSAPILP